MCNDRHVCAVCDYPVSIKDKLSVFTSASPVPVHLVSSVSDFTQETMYSLLLSGIMTLRASAHYQSVLLDTDEVSCEQVSNEMGLMRLACFCNWLHQHQWQGSILHSPLVCWSARGKALGAEDKPGLHCQCVHNIWMPNVLMYIHVLSLRLFHFHNA